jgi:hypothetical protein
MIPQDSRPVTILRSAIFSSFSSTFIIDRCLTGTGRNCGIRAIIGLNGPKNDASRGVKVPEKVGKGKTGNSNFNITDPDGHTVEIIPYEPDSFKPQSDSKSVVSRTGEAYDARDRGPIGNF